MRYVIKLVETTPTMVVFAVCREGDPRPVARVMGTIDAEVAKRAIVRMVVPQGASSQSVVRDLLRRWTLGQLEGQLADGDLRFDAHPSPTAEAEMENRLLGRVAETVALVKAPTHAFTLTDDVFVAVDESKECNFLRAGPTGPLCFASDASDPGKVGQEGVQQIAWTSATLCRSCSMPDARIACSHLVHPRVALQPAGSRLLQQARCDAGKPRIASPGMCQLGSHECWERVVEVQQRPAPGLLPPRAFVEALDHLDAVWHLAFGGRLLQARGGGVYVRLLEPCANKAEFSSHLSALSDLVKSLRIPDSLVPNPKKVPAEASLLRMRACLLDGELDVDRKQVESALAVLASAVDLRNSLQHADSRKNSVEMAEHLGIKYPSSDWQGAWDQVRSTTTAALWGLSHEVRRVADAGKGDG